MGQLTMTTDEREAFLAEMHIGVLSVERPDGPPLATPVWYQYAPGGTVEISTESQTQKAGLLRAANRATLTVQREAYPYAYVTIDGPVTFGQATDELRTAIAVRYLGEELGSTYVANAAHDDDLLIQIRPERWYSIDFSKLEQ